jgi:hypothetical protein
MSRLELFAAAIVASIVATPVLAQEVISNPGYCAFFYPNANCQNKGPLHRSELAQLGLRSGVKLDRRRCAEAVAQAPVAILKAYRDRAIESTAKTTLPPEIFEPIRRRLGDPCSLMPPPLLLRERDQATPVSA